jgi:CheY-like chemotaxis protein
VLRGLVKITLELLGYEVEGACDGIEAVEFARGKPYDLIVLDVDMPRLDGISALAEIRSFDPTVPVIVASASAGGCAAALEVGATAFLLKRPDSFVRDLVGVVREVMRRDSVEGV